MRSYRPPSGSRNFNTLSLVLRTSSPDNLLFFQGSNTTVRSCPALTVPAVPPQHSGPVRFLPPLLTCLLSPWPGSRWTSWLWRRTGGRCLCSGIWVQAAPDWSSPDWTSPTTDGPESTPRGKRATPPSGTFPWPRTSNDAFGFQVRGPRVSVGPPAGVGLGAPPCGGGHLAGPRQDFGHRRELLALHRWPGS